MKFGTELGIRAQRDAVVRAGNIAVENDLDYFLACETNPKIMGADAFEALYDIELTPVSKTKLMTGIVSVYSRDSANMLQLAQGMHEKTGGRFILGIGASTPEIARSYGYKGFAPIGNIESEIMLFKNNGSFPIYMAASGPRSMLAAGVMADGCPLFLQPQSVLKDSLDRINFGRENRLNSPGISDGKNFETILIVPTYMGEDLDKTRASAALTLSNYIIGNLGYSRNLEKAGYGSVVKKIRSEGSVRLGASHVSGELIDDICIMGSPRKCIEQAVEKYEKFGVGLVFGFDAAKDGYNSEFFTNLRDLSRHLSETNGIR